MRATCRHGKKGRWITPYTPVYISLALASVIWFLAMPQMLQRFSIRTGGFGTSSRRRAIGLDFSDDNFSPDSLRVQLAPSPAPLYDQAAIVMLVGGDEAGRGVVALLQSLRDVKTTIRIILLLVRGALGSEACRNPEWKKKVGRPDVDCRGPDTIGKAYEVKL